MLPLFVCIHIGGNNENGFFRTIRVQVCLWCCFNTFIFCFFRNSFFNLIKLVINFSSKVLGFIIKYYGFDVRDLYKYVIMDKNVKNPYTNNRFNRKDINQ